MLKKNSFGKYYKIKNKKLLLNILQDGNKTLSYPILIKWLVIDVKAVPSLGTAFIVSKKKFPKATDRNLIKRRMREAFRTQKHILESQIQNKKLVLAIIYLSKKKENFDVINQNIQLCLDNIKENIIQNKKNEES